MDKRRIKSISESQFKSMLVAKQIRAASLEDVHGTHHKKDLFKHPNTGQYYVKMR